MAEQNSEGSSGEKLERIERRLEELIERMWRMEERLEAAAPGVVEPGSPPLVSEPAPSAEALRRLQREIEEAREGTPRAPSVPQPPATAPRPSLVAPPGPPQPPTEPEPPGGPPPSRPAVDWEAVVGGKWALWVGAFAVFLAVAFFLSYAWQYLSPAGRLAAGFGFGLSFVGAGAFARGRTAQWFGEGLTGGGLAILYLSTWAGYQQYEILPFYMAFALMGAVTAFGVMLSVRYDTVSRIALATLGGFLTPVLLDSAGEGASKAVPFLTYVAVLNAGILAVSLFKRWREITWLSFIATGVLVLSWSFDSYSESLRWPVFWFVTVYFLLFLGASTFYSLLHKEETKPEDLVLLFASSLIYGLAGYAIVAGGLGDYQGVFPASTALFFALFCYATNELAPQNRLLRWSAAGLGLLFITLVIPIQLEQELIAIAWSAEAAILVLLGYRMSSALLQRAGQIVWGLSLFALMLTMVAVEPERQTLFLNERALPLLIAVAGGGLMAVFTRNGKSETGAGGEARPQDDLSPAYAVFTVLAGGWLITQETFRGFEWSQLPSAGTWQSAALFSACAFLAVYSLLTFMAGLALGHLIVRFCAIIVATVAAVLPLSGSLFLPPADWSPFWNLRSASYLVVAFSLAAFAWMLSREKERLDRSESDAAAGAPIVLGIFVLLAVSFEIFFGFRSWGFPVAGAWEVAAFFVIATFWAVYACALFLIGLAWVNTGLRVAGYIVGGIGLFMLLISSLVSVEFGGWIPFISVRFLAFATVIGMLAFGAAVAVRRGEELSVAETSFAKSLGLVAGIVFIWGLTQETYETFRFYGDAFGDHWDRAAQMGVSLVWTICGVAMLVIGTMRKYRPLRLLALGLMGITVVKVFVFDLSFLVTLYRVLSVGGLGLALIGISWLYSRFGRDTEPAVAARR